MNHHLLTDFNYNNKYVLVRVDFNVPVDKKGKVKDNTRIKEALPTINYLIQHQAMVILMTHLGKPDGKVVPELKLDGVFLELKKLLKRKGVYKLDDCLGEEVDEFIGKMIPGEVVLLENLRFYPAEEKNDPGFAQELAKNADYYINDAFGTLHRAHASVDAIANLLPSAAGLLVDKEIKHLHQALQPKKPLVWLVGGIKEDKYRALQQIAKKADYVLVGSGLFDFVKLPPKNMILPVDFVKHKEDKFDIGPKSIKLFQSFLKKAKTIVWNGPLGLFEKPKYANGTKKIAKFIAKLKAVKIIGGGESSEAIQKYKLTQKMTWVSTGGGASLEFLLGKKLPGIAALERSKKKFG